VRWTPSSLQATPRFQCRRPERFSMSLSSPRIGIVQPAFARRAISGVVSDRFAFLEDL
jgi:hypothetical protein